jgi:hypothetical protein
LPLGKAYYHNIEVSRYLGYSHLTIKDPNYEPPKLFDLDTAAIQLSSQGKSPMRGENIEYIYTNSKHKNPLCRDVPVLTKEKEDVARSYDKEKYCDLLLDAAETVLGYFRFDGSIYGKSERGIRSNKQKKWWATIA